MRTKTSRRGFSLLEMMLVLLIMSTLVGIVAINLRGQGERANKRTTYITMRQVEDALDQYYMDNKTYPRPDEGGLSLLVPAYLKEVPEDGWKNELEYYYPTGLENQPFEIISVGPDKVSGTADDMSNWDEAE